MRSHAGYVGGFTGEVDCWVESSRSCLCVEGVQSMEEGNFGGRGKKKSRATGAAAFEVLRGWFFEIHHGNASCNLER